MTALAIGLSLMPGRLTARTALGPVAPAGVQAPVVAPVAETSPAPVVPAGEGVQGQLAAAEEPAPGAPSEASARQAAVALLLSRANFWRAQNRPDMALQALERVLQVEPENLAALGAAAEIAAEQGDQAASQDYLCPESEIRYRRDSRGSASVAELVCGGWQGWRSVGSLIWD